MKRILMCAIVFVILGCSYVDNEEAAIRWVRTAKKPILCNLSVSGELGNKWTLIDANGEVFQTGFTNMRLPDTIKTIYNLPESN